MRSLYAGGGGRSVHPFSYRVGHASRGKRWPIEVLPRRVVNGRTAFAFRHGRAFRSTPFRAFRNGPQHGPFVFFRAASPSSTAFRSVFQIQKKLERGAAVPRKAGKVADVDVGEMEREGGEAQYRCAEGAKGQPTPRRRSSARFLRSVA